MRTPAHSIPGASCQAEALHFQGWFPVTTPTSAESIPSCAESLPSVTPSCLRSSNILFFLLSGASSDGWPRSSCFSGPFGLSGLSSRMLKKLAGGVLASLRGSTYRSVRLASSLAAALLDDLFEHPAWWTPVFPDVQISEIRRAHRIFPQPASSVESTNKLVTDAPSPTEQNKPEQQDKPDKQAPCENPSPSCRLRRSNRSRRS